MEIFKAITKILQKNSYHLIEKYNVDHRSDTPLSLKKFARANNSVLKNRNNSKNSFSIVQNTHGYCTIQNNEKITNHEEERKKQNLLSIDRLKREEEKYNWDKKRNEREDVKFKREDNKEKRDLEKFEWDKLKDSRDKEKFEWDKSKENRDKEKFEWEKERIYREDIKFKWEKEKEKRDKEKLLYSKLRILLAGISILLTLAAFGYALTLQADYQLKNNLNEDLKNIEDLINKLEIVLNRIISSLDEKRDEVSFLNSIFMYKSTDTIKVIKGLLDESNLKDKELTYLIDRLNTIEEQAKQAFSIRKQKYFVGILKTFRIDFLDIFKTLDERKTKLNGLKELLEISILLSNYRMGYKLGNHKIVLEEIINLHNKEARKIVTAYAEKHRLNQNISELDKSSEVRIHYTQRILRRINYELACYLIAAENNLSNLKKNNFIKNKEKCNKLRNTDTISSGNTNFIHPAKLAIVLLMALLCDKDEISNGNLVNAINTILANYNNLKFISVPTYANSQSDLKILSELFSTKKYVEKQALVATAILDESNNLDQSLPMLEIGYSNLYVNSDKQSDTGRNKSLFYNRLGTAFQAISEYDSYFKYTNTNKYMEADKYFRKSLFFSAQSQPYFNIGRNFSLMDQYGNSLDYYTKAEILNPDGPIIKTYKAESLARIDSVGRAMSDIAFALEKDKNNPALIIVQALIFDYRGRELKNNPNAEMTEDEKKYKKDYKYYFTTALEILEKAKNYSGIEHRLDALFNSTKVSCLYELGNINTALKHIESFTNINDIEDFPYYTLPTIYGELLLKHRRYSDAARVLLQADRNHSSKDNRDDLNIRKRIDSALSNSLNKVSNKELDSIVKAKIDQWINNTKLVSRNEFSEEEKENQIKKIEATIKKHCPSKSDYKYPRANEEISLNNKSNTI